MSKSLLLSTLTAAGLAFALGACDEQQASDSSSQPMQQQQGAMPSDQNGSVPATPESSEPQAMESDTMEPETMEPGASDTDGTMPESDTTQ